MSNETTFHVWTGAAWSSSEPNKIKARVIDSLLKPKYAEIILADPDHDIQNAGTYSAYKRIKLVDPTSNKPIFFGRVEFIEAENDSMYGPTLKIQARDFLQELTETIMNKDFSGAATLGDLIKDIIDYYQYTEIIYTAAGGFTVKSPAAADDTNTNEGYWIGVGGPPATSRARLMYIDVASKTLVVTDVIKAEGFINGATLTEYTDEACTTASGITDTQNGALVHNIDTSTITLSGTLPATTATNFVNSSITPLEAIAQLSLRGSETSTVYHFFLNEASNTSLYPPIFTWFSRESRPTGGPTLNGLTIEYGISAETAQKRVMHPEYSFPLPSRESVTEIKALSVDVDNNPIEVVRKAGSTAWANQIFKQRKYQALDKSTASTLVDDANKMIAMLGTTEIHRGNVNILNYPYFYINPNYTIVHSGDKVRVVNSRVTYTAGGVDMVVIEINYEEPPGITTLSLLNTTYGIAQPEYTYPSKLIGTEPLPQSIDTRVTTAIEDAITEPILLPIIIDATFTAVDDDDVSWDNGAGGAFNITFSDATTHSVNAGSLNLANDNPYYLYYILDNTTLQNTQTFGNAVGSDRVLIAFLKKAPAANQKAMIVPAKGGKSPLLNQANISANAITASEIYVTSLSAIQANMGLLTSGEIRVGSGTVGVDFTGFRIWSDYLAGYNANILQAYISSADGKLYAGSGNVILDTNGITLNGSNLITFKNSSVLEGYIYGSAYGISLTGASGKNVSIGQNLSYIGDGIGIYTATNKNIELIANGGVVRIYDQADIYYGGYGGTLEAQVYGGALGFNISAASGKNISIGQNSAYIGDGIGIVSASAKNIDLYTSGGGYIDIHSTKISNVTDPSSNQDAATKKYVDDNASGDTITWLASPSEVYTEQRTSPLTWTDLDLTTATSASAKIVILELYMSVITLDAAGEYIVFAVRKNGDTPTYYPQLIAEYDNGNRDGADLIAQVMVGCDANQVIEYTWLRNGTIEAEVSVRVYGYIE